MRHLTRLAGRYRHLRASLRHDVAVACMTEVNKGVLNDEPRLRNHVRLDLYARIDAEQPLRWRLDDARWYAVNALLALRGRERRPYAWDYTVEVQVDEQSPDLFQRDAAMLRAVKRRVPAHLAPPTA